MVKEFKRKDETVYQCELCDMGYSEIDTAESCEEYCDTHGSCSLEITRKAVYRPPIQFMPPS